MDDECTCCGASTDEDEGTCSDLCFACVMAECHVADGETCEADAA